MQVRHVHGANACCRADAHKCTMRFVIAIDCARTHAPMHHTLSDPAVTIAPRAISHSMQVEKAANPGQTGRGY